MPALAIFSSWHGGDAVTGYPEGSRHIFCAPSLSSGRLYLSFICSSDMGMSTSPPPGNIGVGSHSIIGTGAPFSHAGIHCTGNCKLSRQTKSERGAGGWRVKAWRWCGGGSKTFVSEWFRCRALVQRTHAAMLPRGRCALLCSWLGESVAACGQK